MDIESIVAVLAILLALGFDFVNGFHDTANACATVIYTKALKPGVAIFMSGILNFLGALLVGTAVATVITHIIPASAVTLPIVVAVLLAAVIWNLITWWYGIPVSSSHCLIGSLFGAGITAAGVNGVAWGELQKVIVALLVSPLVGFAAGAFTTWLALTLSKEKEKDVKEKAQQTGIMRWLHIFSSASVSFSHGSNDGQKTMGIITLILATHFASHGYSHDHVPFWVMASAATAMAMGTIIGGWRVIRTVGTKISREKLSHSQGFGASMSTAIIILLASSMGAPISTTHTLSSAVAGGTIPVHGKGSLNPKTMKLILLAWVLTLPVAALLASICYFLLKLVWHA
ncbi:MAG: inorganic phosphate transporter [Cyanobacteria bacterium SZAS LIN-2]|nr:inorganic phosphate transporter [Cyanobacteria bacterium SZAS LIN-3]MBS1999784.1 inorganic phosphate transporter [Cyanobacteria bacterium SZAS LIN-2]MBS2010176.1 inorganic phosphate transporter [Cyanobacteria bacterium SZAS TMP-1]